MTLAVGDVVEIVAAPREIADRCPAKPGWYGVITRYGGRRPERWVDAGCWWELRCGAVDLLAEQSALRKVPGDSDARQTVAWDWTKLKEPQIA